MAGLIITRIVRITARRRIGIMTGMTIGAVTIGIITGGKPSR